MQLLRRFTDAGHAVVAISALNRQRNRNGATYDGAGLASFRESSEMEYGADDAYLLLADQNNEAYAGAMTLAHVKSRHGEPTDLAILFDGAHQSFTAFAPEERQATGLSTDALAQLWAEPHEGGGP
jgi:replicative DNA helicase